jgi:glucose/arabinose dehydrogenase
MGTTTPASGHARRPPRRGSPTHRTVAAWAALLLATTASTAPARAAQLPSGFAETTVASGLSDPTAMALSRDGRIFVCEQGGALRVIKNGQLLARPFVSLAVDSRGERGLLGVALHPDFPATPYVYVYFTATKPQIHNRLSRFTARGDRAAARSGVTLLDLPPLSQATNHNGGAIHFGPDGRLYVGVGENANGANAQSLQTPLGKLLRIRADGRIPRDNPFFGQTSGVARATWALGLRNPFTFAFSRSGRLFINDVGAGTWEEIDEGEAGANYGWPQTEGPTNAPGLVGPLFAYGHGNGPTSGCAIAGGAFYEPQHSGFPLAFLGSYFFADLCSGWIRRLDPLAGNSVSDFASGISQPVDLVVSADGALYYLARGEGGVVRRVTYGP